MAWEYKTVGGPERGRKTRGCRTVADRVAVAMQDIIDAEATGGWEYLRTDLVAVEERRGILGRKQVMHCPVLVFRRETGRPAESAAGREPPRVAVPARPPAAGEPADPLVLGAGQRVDPAPRSPGPPAAAQPAPAGGGQPLFLRRDTRRSREDG